MQISEEQKRYIHIWIMFMMLLTLLIIASTIMGLLITGAVGAIFFVIGFIALVPTIVVYAGI